MERSRLYSTFSGVPPVHSATLAELAECPGWPTVKHTLLKYMLKFSGLPSFHSLSQARKDTPVLRGCVSAGLSWAIPPGNSHNSLITDRDVWQAVTIMRLPLSLQSVVIVIMKGLRQASIEPLTLISYIILLGQLVCVCVTSHVEKSIQYTLFLMLQSAFWLSRYWTIAICPLLEAKCKGVSPSYMFSVSAE